MNAPFAMSQSGQMRRPGEELCTASAELPLAGVIAACQAAFDAIRADAEQEWTRHAHSQGIWLAEYGSKETWIDAMVAEKGPVKLHRLCVAAQAAGQTCARLGAEDFWKIASYYPMDC